MDAWTIYWITRLDTISKACVNIGAPLAIIGFVATFCFVLFRYIEDAPKLLQFLKVTIPMTLAGCIFLSIYVFVPTTKEFVAIYALPKITNNEQIQEIGTNGMEYINEQLKAWIEDVKGKE